MDSNRQKLPNLIRAKYDSGPLPDAGILLASKNCVQHIFNPSSGYIPGSGGDATLLLRPMPRNIVFAIDVSGSMFGQKLRDAKDAFEVIIATLTEDDYFSIHTFSSRGTEESKGPWKATSDSKQNAIQFVRNLNTRGDTNLYGAYMDAIARTKTMIQNELSPSNVVSVILLLTDGRATSGRSTSSKWIANAVRRENTVESKIYAFAFGDDADLPLLTGISLQNGGIAVPIFEGYGDSANQITEFYQGELGSILLSNVRVALHASGGNEGTTTILAEKDVPIFPQGSEVVSRFLLDSNGASTMTSRSSHQTSDTLNLLSDITAITTAVSTEGEVEWKAKPADISSEEDNFDELMVGANDLWTDRVSSSEGINGAVASDCLQSSAFDRILQLLRIRDGALALGNDLWEYVTSDVGPPRSGVDLVAFAEALALEDALEAGLVWPELTALVTTESSSCFGRYEGVEVCHEGDGIDFDGDGYADDGSEHSTAAPADSGDITGSSYQKSLNSFSIESYSSILYIVGMLSSIYFILFV